MKSKRTERSERESTYGQQVFEKMTISWEEMVLPTNSPTDEDEAKAETESKQREDAKAITVNAVNVILADAAMVGWVRVSSEQPRLGISLLITQWQYEDLSFQYLDFLIKISIS